MDEAAELCDDGCYVALTHNHLNVQEVMERVRSPQAGAIVLFAGINCRL
jgi:molybdopterin synthase catalytic subunit